MQQTLKIIVIIVPFLLFSCARLSSKRAEQNREISSLYLYDSTEKYDIKFAEQLFLQIQNELSTYDFQSGCSLYPKEIVNVSMKETTAQTKFHVFNDALNCYQYIKNKLSDFGIEYEVVLSDELKKCSLSPWAMNFNDGMNWLSYKIIDRIVDGLLGGYKPKVSKIRIVLISRNYENLSHINNAKNESAYFKYDGNKIGANIYINPSNQMGDYHHVSDDELENMILDLKNKSSGLPERKSIITSPSFLNKIYE